MSSILIPLKKPLQSRTKPSWIPTINRGSWQAKDLTVWYPIFGEPLQGKIFDISGNGNHADEFNAPSNVVRRISKDGNTLEFLDDTTQWIALNKPTLISENNLHTFTGWIRSDNLGQTNTILSIANENVASPDRFAIGLNSTGVGRFFIDAGAGGHILGTTVLNNTDPIFICGRNTGKNKHDLFVNGLLEDTAAIDDGVDLANLTRLTLGTFADSTPSSPCDGEIWDIRVYNRALSDAEIYALYNTATRYDLWWNPKLYIIQAPSIQDIEGSILTDVDAFNEGFVQPIGLLGSNVEDTDTLNHGSISIGIQGSVLGNLIIDGNG